MSVKDEILQQLESNKGSYISGGQLANNLGVSRNAVWKAIKSLEKNGYQITAVPNKGYCPIKMIFFLLQVLISI